MQLLHLVEVAMIVAARFVPNVRHLRPLPLVEPLFPDLQEAK